MKIIIKQYLFVFSTAVALSFCVPVVLHAKSLNLNGNWTVFFQGVDDETTADGLVQFRQIYNATWVPMITRQMSLTANMGYSNNWFEGLGTREIINPTVQFGVKNDIFTFGLNGNVVQNNMTFRQDVQTTAWNANLSSSWTNYLWPELTLRMGQRFENSSDFGSNRPETDNNYSFIGSSVTWKAYKFKLYYDYTKSRRDEEIGLDSTQQDSEGHLGKLEYSDNFWNNRVSLNFSQLIYDYQVEYSSATGNTLLKVPVSSALSGVDITPGFGLLPFNQALIDGNKITSAITIQLQQKVNLALRTSFKSVERLYVYTTKDDNLLVANTDAVTWDLYTSGDGVTWQMVAADVSSSYNTSEFRFEVLTGTIRAEYMKLVVTGWIPALDIDISEIEAYTFPATDSSGRFDTDTRNYKTELYLGVNPIVNTRFNYSLSWDRNESKGTIGSETTQLIQTARFAWDYSRYLSPSIGFSNIVNENDSRGATDTETRTYNLHVRSNPIPTVDLGFSYNWSEYFENEERSRTNNNVSLTALLALYPDLSTELTVGYNQAKSDTTGNESDGIFVNFIMRSQLRKTLNVDFQANYYSASSDTIINNVGNLGLSTTAFQNTSGDGGENILSVNWRPSNILSFSLRGQMVYDSKLDNEYGGYFIANYLVFRTSKTSLTFNYGLNSVTDRDVDNNLGFNTVNNIGLVWGWDISRHFAINTSGNYLISEDENSWRVYSQLTSKF